MEKKYDIRFYSKKDGYVLFIIPTIVFFYRSDYFWESGVHTPAFGMSFKWLKFNIGFMIQINPYYEK